MRIVKRRVLVVDDYEDNRQLYAETLVHSGFEVDEAVDGLEALAKADAVTPDAIVMDLSMPRMDGWEAIRRLRAEPRTRSTPIIVLSGHAVGDELERAMKAGADEACPKPCTPDDLVRRVRKLLA
jgi:CheY-like chemotaxis protein